MNVGKQRVLQLLLRSDEAFSAAKKLRRPGTKTAYLVFFYASFRAAVRANDTIAVNGIYESLTRRIDSYIKSSEVKNDKQNNN